MPDLVRYPIGEFAFDPAEFPRRKDEWITQLGQLPAKLRASVRGLTDVQLDTSYRKGGWTLGQVVHHIADSHMQSLFRMKLALTERQPLVKPYDQDAFVKLADSLRAPLNLSLELIDSLHARWVLLLKALKLAQFKRVFVHPDYGEIPVSRALAHYAWHGRQHTAHITGLRQRKGW